MAVGKKRAEAMASTNPELEDYVAGLTDLARQEFGLTGVPFSDVVAVIDRAYKYTPVPFVNGKDTPEEAAARTQSRSAPACPARGTTRTSDAPRAHARTQL